jgi:hypothetical protein
MHAQDHDHQVVPSDPALRTKALESLLVEKGLVDPAALDAIVDTYENKIGPRNGARVVARACGKSRPFSLRSVGLRPVRLKVECTKPLLDLAGQLL